MTSQISPRTDSPFPLYLVNDHDEAYSFWKNLGIKQKTLVHFDAHIDFEWIAEKNAETLFRSASSSALSETLRNPFGWSLSTPDHQKVHLGNYLHKALKEGMVGRWYWVVPDPMWQSAKVRERIWHDLLDYHRFRSGPMDFPRKRGQVFETSFLGVPTVVGSLESLPVFSEPVLLNIDVDYLTAQVFEQIPPPSVLRRQRPWIWPETLLQQFRKKNIVPEAAVIARSVNGGYTPIGYKFFGEVLKTLLKENKFPEAYESLQKFFISSEAVNPHKALETLNSFQAQGEMETARLYQKALAEFQAEAFEEARGTFARCGESDPEFYSTYNSNARFYESCGKFKEALEEHRMMRVLLPDVLDSLAGEAKCLTALNELSLAKGKCLQVLEWDSEHPEALFLLGKLLLSEKKYSQAVRYLQRCEAVKPQSVMAKILLGEAFYEEKAFREAKKRLREALGGGAHFPVTYFLLAKTYWKLGYYKKSIELFLEWARLAVKKRYGI